MGLKHQIADEPLIRLCEEMNFHKNGFMITVEKI
jgi:hypothetical protein